MRHARLIVLLVFLVTGCSSDSRDKVQETPSSGTPVASPAASPQSGTGPTPAGLRAAVSTPAAGVRLSLSTEVEVYLGPSDRLGRVGRLRPGSYAAVQRYVDNQWVGVDGVGWLRYAPGVTVLDSPIETLPDYFVEIGRILTPPHPSNFRTTWPQLDAVIELVERRDTEALDKLVRLRSVACAIADRSRRSPTCPQGTAVGTALRVFPAGSCEGEFYETAPFSQAFRTSERAPRLLAVYENPRTQDEQFAMVFVSAYLDVPSRPDSVKGWSFSITTDRLGAITTLHWSCGPTSLLERDQRLLIPPPLPPGVDR
jgi:hypothetical protein